MSNTNLLQEFLIEECDPHVRLLILQALEEVKTPTGMKKREFEFNRFSIALNYADKLVLIQDDLDVSTEGQFQCSIDEFLKIFLQDPKV